MINKSPAFQFYPGDFLSDENVISMNFEERGIYITLLSTCWIQGSIPADPEKLKRLLPGYINEDGMPSQVMNCFKEMECDSKRLVHPRLERERLKQEEWREKSSQAGKKSAEKRQLKQNLKGGSKLVQPNSNSLSLSSSSSSSLNQNTQERVDWFLEDWETYPRKEGNKTKAQACYLKTVTTPEKRKSFQEKMKAYVQSVEDFTYLKHGETFFRNWEALVIPKPKGYTSPMVQAMAGRGEFVDKVTDRAEALFAKNEDLGRAGVADLVIGEMPDADRQASQLILYNYSWIDNPPPGVKIEPT